MFRLLTGCTRPGALTVTASVNDNAGNHGQTTHTLTVDTVAPTVTISTVADDDIVNNAEQLAARPSAAPPRRNRARQ